MYLTWTDSKTAQSSSLFLVELSHSLCDVIYRDYLGILNILIRILADESLNTPKLYELSFMLTLTEHINL